MSMGNFKNIYYFLLWWCPSTMENYEKQKVSSAILLQLAVHVFFFSYSGCYFCYSTCQSKFNLIVLTIRCKSQLAL